MHDETAAQSQAVQERAAVLLREHQRAIYRRTDRMFAGLMAIQWLAGVAAALWIAPNTWIGSESRTHAHVWAAIFLGGAISSFPIYLALRHPGTTLTRYVIAVAQMLTSSLLIHLTGGRLETHFHVFGSLAFLSCYRDWKILIPATLIVAVDHGFRGFFYPQSVYGIMNASNWRWLEHSAWVLFEDAFLIVAIRQSLHEMWVSATQHAVLEDSKELIKSHNKKLEEYGRQAEAASRAKTEFLANVSHEIRTPMQVILGYADLMEHGLCSDEKAIPTIRRNGEYLVTLLNDILDLSKIEADKLEVERIPCSPCKVIHEVVTLMQVRADEKGIALEENHEGPVPDVIYTDPTRLRQILINLIGNAIKFTDSGTVTVVSQVKPDKVGQPHLQIQVADTGIGISEQQLGHVFHAFVQADSSTTRRYGGTGLGLAICKRLAPMLGGDIEVRSRPGEGTTFTLSISCGRPSVPLSVNNAASTAAAPAFSKTSSRILLVEDSLDTQAVISQQLKQLGATVSLAGNGEEGAQMALEAAAVDNPFDLILIDMQMPIMDGYTATRRLREQRYKGPIVAITAHAMVGDREKCLGAGCDEFMTKPIDRKALFEVVERHLESAAPARV